MENVMGSSYCSVRGCMSESYWHYHGEGEDTFDFDICKKHMMELWVFIGEQIELN